MYDVGVGRVQTRFPQHRSKFFITSKEGGFRIYELKHNATCYDIWEWSLQDWNSISLDNLTKPVQVGKYLFLVGGLMMNKKFLKLVQDKESCSFRPNYCRETPIWFQ